MINKLISEYKSMPVMLGAIALGVLTLGSVVIGLFVSKPESQVMTPTADLVVIAAPTATSYLPTSTPTRVPTATANIRPSPLPGMIGVGGYVQIFGTEGAGLNIRSEPGLNSEIKFLAFDQEVFLVRDGPFEVDGINWWLLVTPVDEDRNGWAAANYLSVVEGP